MQVMKHDEVLLCELIGKEESKNMKNDCAIP